MKWTYESALFKAIFKVKDRLLKWDIFGVDADMAKRSVTRWFPTAEIISVEQYDREKSKKMIVKRGYEFIS